MPTNVTIEYILAEKEFRKASTPEEKIKALKLMLSTVPSHKGCEKLRKDIRKRLAKLKKELKSEKKAKKTRQVTIKKEGAATICIVGLPNSRKSTLLKKLSGKDVEIASYPFTTKEATQRMIPFDSVLLQGIEIPALYLAFSESKNGKQLFGLIRNADLVLVVVKEERELTIILEEFRKAGIKLGAEKKDYHDFTLYLPSIIVYQKDFDDINLKTKMWSKLNLIRVFTKTKKGVAERPVVLKIGSTVKELAEIVHKDFVKKFKYAKVSGPSSKFPDQQVGLEHELKDKDVVEIFTR